MSWNKTSTTFPGESWLTSLCIEFGATILDKVTPKFMDAVAAVVAMKSSFYLAKETAKV